MAFQAHGSFSEFSSSQETWTAYVQRLEQYLAANKIEDADQQRAILLSGNLLADLQLGVTQEACRIEIQRDYRNCSEAP